MYTVFQDSNNHIQIPFKGDFDYLLIKFTYRCTNVFGIFENTKGTGCDYEINIVEVGSDGTVDKENGQIKLSPRSTWKAKIYGQDGNVNLAPENATFLYGYDFQIKGNDCTVYPSGSTDCLPATAIIEDQDGNVLASEEIPSGATEIITVNVQKMINVAKGDFTGVFDLSVQDQNGFYNDYTEGTIISVLSLAVSPKLGSIATVRILGGLLGANSIPEPWGNFSSDTISQDNTQFNVLTILYVASDDVRIVNNVITAPDLVAPEFTSTPTATNITETSFDITAQLNENGTVYGYLLPDGSAAPTTQEVIDNAQSQFTDTGAGGTLSFTGLTTETNYDIYVIAEDAVGNRQANSTLVEVTTAIQQSYETIILNKGITVYDASLIDLSGVNVRDTGTQKFLINWLDQSPNLNNAAQATNGNQFLIEEPGKSLIPDGVDDFMNSTSLINFDSILGYSAYFVLNKDDSENLQVILNNTASTAYNIFTIKNVSNYEFRINDGTNNLSFVIGTDPSDILGDKIFEIHHDDSGNAELLINGVSKDTLTGQASVLKRYNRIGSRTTGLFLTGKVNAIQSYQLLNSTERISIREALASKFGITL